jgi:hypothetical protein
MYCNNCGEQLSAVARFCSQCGTVRSGQKLNGTTQAAFDAHKYKMGILGAMSEYYEKAFNDWTITPHQAADILEELKKFVKFRGSPKKSARSRERSPINGPTCSVASKYIPGF